MISEKPKPINPTSEPKPANGTPAVSHIIDRTTTAKKKKALRNIPKNEIHNNGAALNASKLLNDIVIAAISENSMNLDSPANLGGLCISIVAVLNPTQAPSPRTKL